MFPLSLEAKLIAAALAVAALAGGVFWVVHDLEARGAAAVVAAQAEANAAQAVINQAETTRRESVQQENLREANSFNAQAAVDARDLAAVVQRVHVAATRERLATRDSVTAAGSPTSEAVPTAADLPDELCERAVDAAAAIAQYADCLRTSGQLCALDYLSLNRAAK